MACAMLRMAIRPDEQSLLMTWMGTWAGTPAESAAEREMYNGEGGWHVPTAMSCILLGSMLVSANVA